MLRLDGSFWPYLNVVGGGSETPASHETVDKKKHYLYQDGKTVFKNAIIGMTDISSKIIERNNLTAKDIDILIPHQANIRIIDSVSKRLGIDQERVVINIEKYGNTTAGTIPVAMSEAYQKNMMHKGDQILISAFGAGFAWGSLLLKWAID